MPVGPDADRPDTLVQSKFSGGDDFVWTHGSHTVKFGVVITRVQTNNRQIAYSAGQYALAQLSLQAWISGEPFIDFAVPPGSPTATGISGRLTSPRTFRTTGRLRRG